MILTTISDAASAFAFGVFAKIKESQRAKIGREKIMVLRMSLRKLAVQNTLYLEIFQQIRVKLKSFLKISSMINKNT